MSRIDERNNDELREITIEKDYLKNADGSVLISFGDTKVICTASVDERVPNFIKGSNSGWVTAEYSMLPASTQTRKNRDRIKGIDGRSQEIQRLIGRSLRSIVDLEKLGERQIIIDCDVIQADGGTRTASITGGFVALQEAINKLIKEGKLEENPLTAQVAAVSVGVDGESEEAILDLNYHEDSNAVVDMNVVMTDQGEIVEIQGTGEERPFKPEELNQMLTLAQKGLKEIHQIQKEANEE